MQKVKCNLTFNRSRYIVFDYDLSSESEIIESLKTIFGIHSISIATQCISNIDEITKVSIELSKIKGTFRVNCNRADKKFSLSSLDVCRELGGRLLDNNEKLSVDLHNPDFIINVDIRENGKTFIYSDKILCAGGMPVGSSGKGLLMLSGGIDSPVAGFMMAKRGLCFDAIHFHSYPYTSEMAKQKVIDLAKILENYCGHINLIVIPFTKIQEAIHEKTESSYMITLIRRAMMTISERVAHYRNCGCLINGESLGQVASQTMESITVTNSMVTTMPIFRPLIGMDKLEIVNISEKINTYKTSILPYEDCCTVFLPESPITKPTIERALREENKIQNLTDLIDDAFNNLEIIKI